MRLYDDRGREVIKLDNVLTIGANTPGGVAHTYLRLDGSSNLVADGTGLVHDNANSRSQALNGFHAIRGAGGVVSSPDLVIGANGVGFYDPLFNSLGITLDSSTNHFRFQDGIFEILRSNATIIFGSLQDCELHYVSPDTLEMRRSTNPNSFRVYNTYAGGADYERLSIGWTANVCWIDVERAGTGTQRPIYFDAQTYRWYQNGAERMRLDTTTLQLAGTDNPLSFGITAGTPDVYLRRHAANELSMRNGTNAQSLYLYGTYSSAGANYERLHMGLFGTDFIFRSQNAGTGTSRPFKFDCQSYQFQTGGVTKWGISNSGQLYPFTNNSYPIGTTSLRVSDYYGIFATLKSGGASGADTRVGGCLNSYHGDVGNAAALESDLWSYTVPGSTLTTDGQDIEFWGAGEYSASASGDKRVRVYYGGTLIFDTGPLGPGASDFLVKGHVMRDGASAQKCIVDIECSDASVTLNTTYTLLAKDNTASQILKITGSGAATGDVILRAAKANFHRE